MDFYFCEAEKSPPAGRAGVKILLHAVGFDKQGLLWHPHQGERKKSMLIPARTTFSRAGRLIWSSVCYIQTKKIWVHGSQ